MNASEGPPWRLRTVRRGSVDLAVFEVGDASSPTVLLVHGWPDTHHLWNGVAERLADDFHVVAYDTRGMGESADPGSTEAFALPELALDLFAVADAVSPDAPVHVVAHDWGSTQGWEAVCEPQATERIASFVSMSGPCVDHVALWMRRTLRHPTLSGLRRVAAQSAASWYMWVFISPLAPLLLRRFGSIDRWQDFLHDKEGIAPSPLHHGPTFAQDLVSGLRYYRANVLSRLRHPRERRTAVPVLLLVLLQDVAIRPDSLEDIGRWATDLERRELPYGHWAALAAPEVVADEATRFIRERGTPSAP